MTLRVSNVRASIIPGGTLRLVNVAVSATQPATGSLRIANLVAASYATTAIATLRMHALTAVATSNVRVAPLAVVGAEGFDTVTQTCTTTDGTVPDSWIFTVVQGGVTLSTDGATFSFSAPRAAAGMQVLIDVQAVVGTFTSPPQRYECDVAPHNSWARSADGASWVARSTVRRLTSPLLVSTVPTYSFSALLGGSGALSTTGQALPTQQLAGSGALSSASTSWNLVFRDEFDAPTLDLTVWDTNEGYSVNNTTAHTANVSIANSCAVLTLASSTSGAQIASNAALFQVGDYIEFRALFPGDGIGLYNWPAVWTSGPNWPTAGEIDIAEVLGNGADDNNITVNYHHGATAGADTANNYGTPAAGYWGDQFHTFGAVRKATTFDIYWDGVKVLADKPTADNGGAQNILASMGTHLSSGPDLVGQSLLVDYVRIYRPA